MNEAAPRASFWQRRIVTPLLSQLRQGITPEKIALTLALGLVLGVFPVLGSSTLLCAIAGIALRLNQPIIQAVNYVVYPAQLVLLIPFYRAGEDLFGTPHVPIFSVVELLQRFRDGPLQFVVDYGMVALYGITVWCLVAPLVVGLVYVVARVGLKRLAAHVPRTT
jgi:uncharacterized protein (DUF2062 family)